MTTLIKLDNSERSALIHDILATMCKEDLVLSMQREFMDRHDVSESEFRAAFFEVCEIITALKPEPR